MSPNIRPKFMPRVWPSLGYVCAAVLVSFSLIVLFRFAYEVRAVLVILLFAVLLALVLVFPIDFFTLILPRWLATLLTLCLTGALGVGALLAATPYFSRQLQWLVDNAPGAIQGAQKVWRDFLPASVRTNEDWSQPISHELGKLLSQALPVAFNALSFVSGTVAALALAFFLAHGGAQTRSGLLRLVPKSREATFALYLTRVGRELQRWTLGQLTAMTVTGLLIGLGLLILGIESWFVLGAISFVLEFVPYVGPLLSSVPGIAAGFAISPNTAFRVTILYMAVQFVESYALQPLIMKRAIRIQPALQLLWQLAMASAFGILGVFVATPLLACVQVTVQHFYIEGWLGRKDGNVG